MRGDEEMIFRACFDRKIWCHTREIRFSFSAATLLLMFLVCGETLAVPGNEPDPPMPPSDFGNLFDDGSPRVYDCRVDQLRSDATQSTVVFRSNLPHNRARYWQSGATWSGWTSLSANEYVCNSPACLWLAGSVEIRGCLDAAGTNCPGLCTVNVGAGAAGMPVVGPLGLPAAAVGHAGCAESDHTTVKFEARWTGAKASGYPTVVDGASNPVALTFVTSRISGAEFIGTYTIPAGWAAGFTGTWPFTFSIGPSRAAPVNLEVLEHCLEAPEVYQVATGGVRTRVYAGQTVMVASASEMVIETGNSGLALTNHQLDPSTETLGTVFTPPVPTPGATQPAGWSEAGEAWDTVVYRSPETDITLEGATAPCVSDGTHRFWLDPAANTVTLAAGTAWAAAPTIRTDGCAGVTPGTPSGANEVVVVVGAGSVTTGWPVQVRATTDRGGVSDQIDFAGEPGWVLLNFDTYFNVERAVSCLAGERAVGLTCQPCPTHKVCSGGVTVDQQYCGSGSPPPDAPCTLADCAVDERLVSGVCEACPDYQICNAGSLITDKYCRVGAPPGDASEVTYDSCVAGVTTAVTECVAFGDPSPTDSPCPPCTPPAPGSETYELDAAYVRVALPDSTDWVAAPSIVTNVCGGSPPSVSSSNSDARISFGAFIAEPGGGRWPIEVAAVLSGGEVDELFYWYSSGWNLGGNWYFHAERGPLTCVAGQRVVAGVCEACPTHEVCSAGVTVDQQYCGTGSAPADAPCVTSCPSGQRVVRGICESCPTYFECAGGSLVQRQHCAAGSPPASATEEAVRTCVGGVTQTNTMCVAGGGTRPADTPCTSCPSGQRLVAGSCQTCPTYTTCSASTGSNRNLTTSNTFCSAGNPPNDVTVRWNIACVRGNSEVQWQCIGTGGLPSNPGEVPCSGDRCIYYEGCRQDSSTQRGQMTQQYFSCSSNPVAPPAPQVIPRLECEGRGQTWEWDLTRYYCVGTGGLSDISEVPADDPCSSSCTDYTTCTSDWTPSSNPASRLLATATYCGSDSPPSDAYTVTREVCNGGYDYDYHLCIGENGYTSDPGDQPCSTCSSTQRLVNGSCESCPWYYTCNGNNRVRQRWCNSGSPPADARTASYQSCVGGSTVTTNTCVPPGGSTPADDPCPTSCGTNERLVGGSCQPCPTYQVCSSGVTVDRYHCGSGSPPSDSPCATSCPSGERRVNGSCEACPTYEVCSSGVTVERQYCGSGSAPSDSPCATSCPSGERRVNGSCEACPTYWSCSGNSRVERTWCNSGSAPGDAWLASYQACSGGSEVTRTACVAAGGSAPSDETPCCVDYQACSGTSLVTREYCGSGSAPGNARLESYQACVGGSTVTRTACVAPGGNAPADDPCATCVDYQACSGTSLQTREYCGSGSPPDNAYLHTYNTCSGGVAGTSEECIGPGDSETADAQMGEQTYCDSNAVEQTRDVCGADSDITPLPNSCPSGQELNSDGCCESCPQTAEPDACPRVGQAWEWHPGACEYRVTGVGDCPSGFTSRWQAASCSYQCTPPVVQCSAVLAPTSGSDCTESLSAYRYWQGGSSFASTDGWWMVTHGPGLGPDVISGDTGAYAGAALCIPCEGGGNNPPPQSCESTPPTSVADCTESIPQPPGVTTTFEFQFRDPTTTTPGVASIPGWYLYRVSTLPGFGGDFPELLLCKPCP